MLAASSSSVVESQHRSMFFSPSTSWGAFGVELNFFSFLSQSIAAYLASEGRQVTLVFEKTDAFLAYSSPLPAFLRRSR